MKLKNQTKKNKIFEIEITDINNSGYGVGRINGVVTFVSGGCTGDILSVKVIKTASDYNVAKIENIIKSSPYRCDPVCKAFKRCGGCVYRHITYDHELELKKLSVESSMKKAGVDVTVLPVISTGVTDFYRNKAQYPVGFLKNKDNKIQSVVGFYAGKTHDIIPNGFGDDACLLQPKIFGEIVDFIRAYLDDNSISPYDEVSNTGDVRHIYLRISEYSDDVMLCIVSTVIDDRIKKLVLAACQRFPEIKSGFVNINKKSTNVILGDEYIHIYGEKFLSDKLEIKYGNKNYKRTFEFSPQSFWQVNKKATELLYSKAAEMLGAKSGERILDLFCGIGTVGMSVCSTDVKLLGAEIVPEAVENAKRNAELNSFEDAEFVCLDASDKSLFYDELCAFSRNGLDGVILDPPRKGCSSELLDTLCELSPKRIVYISCNPDTLARDIAYLKGKYFCDFIQPVDLFSRTGHVENVVCLKQIAGD